MALSLTRDKLVYRPVLLLYPLYLCLDIAAALMLLPVLEAGSRLIHGSLSTAAAVVAGLTGPLLIRANITFLTKNRLRTINAMGALRALQIRIAQEIDERSAASETDWVLDVVLPSLASTSVETVAKWVLEALPTVLARSKLAITQGRIIKNINAAASIDAEEDAKHLIVQILLDNGGRRPVQELVRSARKADQYGSVPAYPRTPLQSGLRSLAGSGGLMVRRRAAARTIPSVPSIPDSREDLIQRSLSAQRAGRVLDVNTIILRSETTENGTGELTLSQPGKSSFFHVSFSEEAITVGCSTLLSPEDCFSKVASVARSQKAFALSINSTEIHCAVQRRNPPSGDVEVFSIQHDEDSIRAVKVAQRLAREHSADMLAMRVDFGESSWQWDDLSTDQWPDRRCFGGLVARSALKELLIVMGTIGDEWVSSNLEDLETNARDFLDHHAP
jgi:hypothetical protein